MSSGARGDSKYGHTIDVPGFIWFPRVFAETQQSGAGPPTVTAAEQASTPVIVRTEAELRIILAPVVTNVWPMDRLLALCFGWYDGKIARAIGRELGVSKSAILGKADRLIARGILTPRWSAPKDQSDEAKRLRARDNERDYRRRKAEAESNVALALERGARLPPVKLNRPLRAEPKPKAAERYVPPPIAGRIHECCWPLGEPGQPSFHFCDKPTDPGRPYCRKHVAKAYVRMPSIERREARA